MSDTCERCGADFAIGDQSVQVPIGTICTKCTVAGDEYLRQLHVAYEVENCSNCNGEGCGACHNTGMAPVTREQFFAGCLEAFSRALTSAVSDLEREYKSRDEEIPPTVRRAVDWVRCANMMVLREAAANRGIVQGDEEEVAA